MANLCRGMELRSLHRQAKQNIAYLLARRPKADSFPIYGWCALELHGGFSAERENVRDAYFRLQVGHIWRKLGCFKAKTQCRIQ